MVKTEDECAARAKAFPIVGRPQTKCPTVFNGTAFKSFHHVYLNYCDGGLFAGDRAEPLIHEQGTEKIVMYMRGKRILDHMLHTLSIKFGMYWATEILFTGGSAGALTLYNSADYIGKQLPPFVQKYGVAPNNGYWSRPLGDYTGHDDLIRLPGPTAPVMEGEDVHELAEMKQLFRNGSPEETLPIEKLRTFKNFVELHNISATFADGCKQAMPFNRQWHCAFADVSYRYSKTPMFVMQVIDEFMVTENQTTDDDATDNVNCLEELKKNGYTKQLEECDPSRVNKLNNVINGIVSNLQTTEKYYRPGEGGIVSACNYHTDMEGPEFVRYGKYDALDRWFNGDAGIKSNGSTWHLPCHYNQNPPYQCDPICGFVLPGT